MADPFIGEIRIFGFSYAPRGWAVCDGGLLQIAQHSAVYAILGTTYGGNGTTTFALPNLQGKAAMHWGTTPGLAPTVIGQVQGSDTVTLTTAQLPTHTHIFQGGVAAGGASQLVATPIANGLGGGQPASARLRSGRCPPGGLLTASDHAVGRGAAAFQCAAASGDAVLHRARRNLPGS